MLVQIPALRKQIMDSCRDLILGLGAQELKIILAAHNKPSTGRVAVLRSRVLRLVTDTDPATLSAQIKNLHQKTMVSRESRVDSTTGGSGGARVPPTSGSCSARRSRVSEEQEPVVEVEITPVPGSYPLHPDVEFKPLPFYQVLGELVKPSTLTSQVGSHGDCSLVFHLTPVQAGLIRANHHFRNLEEEYAVQVQLRVGLLETTSPQDDCYPPGLMVWVNRVALGIARDATAHTSCTDDQKRAHLPLDVTSYIRSDPMTANIIQVRNMPHFQRFVAAVYLVRKNSWQVLNTQLRGKGLRVAYYTKGFIQQKLKNDLESDIATTCLRVSLVCPLGRMRMNSPCRATTCSHVQCFDGVSFLQMNEKKPVWSCPVCEKPALYENLVIDEYFVQVLTSPRLPPSCTEIQLMADGDWRPFDAVSEAAPSTSSRLQVQGRRQEFVELGSSDEECAVLECKVPFPRITPRLGLAALPAGAVTDMVDLTSSPSPPPSPARSSGDESTPYVLPFKKRRTIMEELSGSASPAVIELDSDSPAASPTPASPPRDANRQRRKQSMPAVRITRTPSPVASLSPLPVHRGRPRPRRPRIIASPEPQRTPSSNSDSPLSEPPTPPRRGRNRPRKQCIAPLASDSSSSSSRSPSPESDSSSASEVRPVREFLECPEDISLSPARQLSPTARWVPPPRADASSDMEDSRSVSYSINKAKSSSTTLVFSKKNLESLVTQLKDDKSRYAGRDDEPHVEMSSPIEEKPVTKPGVDDVGSPLREPRSQAIETVINWLVDSAVKDEAPRSVASASADDELPQDLSICKVGLAEATEPSYAVCGGGSAQTAMADEESNASLVCCQNPLDVALESELPVVSLDVTQDSEVSLKLDVALGSEAPLVPLDTALSSELSDVPLNVKLESEFPVVPLDATPVLPFEATLDTEAPLVPVQEEEASSCGVPATGKDIDSGPSGLLTSLDGGMVREGAPGSMVAPRLSSEGPDKARLHQQIEAVASQQLGANSDRELETRQELDTTLDVALDAFPTSTSNENHLTTASTLKVAEHAVSCYAEAASTLPVPMDTNPCDAEPDSSPPLAEDDTSCDAKGVNLISPAGTSVQIAGDEEPRDIEATSLMAVEVSTCDSIQVRTSSPPLEDSCGGAEAGDAECESRFQIELNRVTLPSLPFRPSILKRARPPDLPQSVRRPEPTLNKYPVTLSKEMLHSTSRSISPADSTTKRSVRSRSNIDPAILRFLAERGTYKRNRPKRVRVVWPTERIMLVGKVSSSGDVKLGRSCSGVSGSDDEAIGSTSSPGVTKRRHTGPKASCPNNETSCSDDGAIGSSRCGVAGSRKIIEVPTLKSIQVPVATSSQAAVSDKEAPQWRGRKQNLERPPIDPDAPPPPFRPSILRKLSRKLPQ